ncbi:MAG: phytase [Pseudomonadota bacterium]
MGQNKDGSFNAGVTTKSGRYEQFDIAADGSELIVKNVREFSTLIQTEGCAFDDRTEHLYLAKEEGDLLRYSAKPEGDDTSRVIAKAGDFGMLADLEGVTVYEEGSDGGYVIVSSQGNNSYVAFTLPDLDYAGRFRIVDGSVDGVTSTDGIAVTSIPTEKFPEGFFIAQDDMDETSPSEPRKKQNFKVVDWRDIIKTFE